MNSDMWLLYIGSGMIYLGGCIGVFNTIRSFFLDVCDEMNVTLKNILFILSVVLYPIFCMVMLLLGIAVISYIFIKDAYTRNRLKEDWDDFWNWR